MAVEVVDEPLICSKEEAFGFVSPIHTLPLTAAEAPPEPQSTETRAIGSAGLFLVVEHVVKESHRGS